MKCPKCNNFASDFDPSSLNCKCDKCGIQWPIDFNFANKYGNNIQKRLITAAFLLDGSSHPSVLCPYIDAPLTLDGCLKCEYHKAIEKIYHLSYVFHEGDDPFVEGNAVICSHPNTNYNLTDANRIYPTEA
jgi:hypothetical protein